MTEQETENQEVSSKERIIKNPYPFILNWAETRFKHYGKRVFYYSTLQPISLIMPGIPYGETSIRGNISTLLLSPSGCVDGETYITTAIGTFKKIKNFGESHLQKINQKVRINSLRNEPPTSKAVLFQIYENEEKLKIILDTGREIITNLNHPLLINDPKLMKRGNRYEEKWVKARDLKIGDLVRVVHRIHCFKKTYEKFDIKLNPRSKSIKIPFCNEEVATIMGYGLGDGHCKKRYRVEFYINKEEEDLIHVLSKFIKENFQLDAHFRIKDTIKYHSEINGRKINRTQTLNTLVVDNDNFNKIFQFIREKRIPEIIMGSKASVVASFLRGLFEADGTCDKNRRRIALSSVNNLLLQDVLLLLLKFGIRAKIYGINLTIEDLRDIKKFGLYINFLSEKKKKILLESINLINVQRKRRGRNVQYAEKIKKIEKLEKGRVYDLEVEKYHRYIANGIISHNSAKTAVTRVIEKITYDPLHFERITEAKAEDDLNSLGKSRLSVLCWDVDRVFRDKGLIKVLEGALGDEQNISKRTMRGVVDEKVNVIFYGAGLPQVLTAYSQRGLVQRLIPIVVFHTPEEKREIAAHINNMIGSQGDDEVESVQDKIKSYYDLILECQMGRHEEFKKIDSYIIPDSFKEKILAKWNEINLTKRFKQEIYTFRELHDAYRFLCASAMLNRFQRKVETFNGKNFLLLEENDLKLALHLFTKEMNTKFDILNMGTMMNDAGSQEAVRLYKNIINNEDVSFVDKSIAGIFIENKVGSIGKISSNVIKKI